VETEIAAEVKDSIAANTNLLLLMLLPTYANVANIAHVANAVELAAAADTFAEPTLYYKGSR